MGPNSFPMKLYSEFWDVVGEGVMQAITEFH